jgi:uncharacterized protein YabE (DUF348 family)
MKLLRKKSIWPYIASGILVFFAFILFAVETKNADAASNQGQHLITIYDRSQQTTILTNAENIEGALKDANINLDPNDIVEPGLKETLVASSYDVNIYRARPVTIIDGNIHRKIMTAYQTPVQIAAVAGIKLYDEDKTEMLLSDNIAVSGAGLEMKITRAKSVSVNMYGKLINLRTQAKNIEGFLSEKSVELGQADKLSLPLSTEIVEGLTFSIWREGVQTIAQEESIQFDTEIIKDANRYVGYREVKSSGTLGTKNVTYEVSILNGKETSRSVIASVVMKNPVAEIVVVGTKYNGPQPSLSDEQIGWLKSASIAESDWGYVDYIITKESNWHPNSVNSSSGACGLAQALPCNKVPGNPLDPVDSLIWANGYATKRYSSWENAYNFWTSHKWW